MKPCLLAIVSSLIVIACTSPSEDEKNAIEEACRGQSIEEVKKIDDISEECKSAISALLPSPTNNVSTRLLNLGIDTKSSRRKLVLAGTDAQGNPLTIESLREMELFAVTEGLEQKIAASNYSITKALDTPSDLMSISLVGDYSGSMSDTDIGLVSELFTDFTQYLTPIANFEVIYFSNEVNVQQSLTSDLNLLKAALQKNTTIPRTSTALYDAMGKGAENLATSSRPGHLLIVGTDGMENASIKFTKESIRTALSTDKNLLVVIMGTFLSDINEMKELAGERGVFVYAQDVKKGKETVLLLSQSLRESIVIELSEIYQSVPEWKAQLGGATVSFKL